MIFVSLLFSFLFRFDFTATVKIVFSGALLDQLKRVATTCELASSDALEKLFRDRVGDAKLSDFRKRDESSSRFVLFTLLMLNFFT